MKLNTVFLTIIGIALTACSQPSKYKKEPSINPLLLMQPGMSKQEVITILGEPYTKKGYGKIERYCYLMTGGGNWIIRFDANGRLELSQEHYGGSRCENFNHI